MSDRYYYFGPYQTDKEWEESKDVMQIGDEFQEPKHWRTRGAGVEWHRSSDSRIGGKPCKECSYALGIVAVVSVFNLFVLATDNRFCTGFSLLVGGYTIGTIVEFLRGKTVDTASRP